MEDSLQTTFSLFCRFFVVASDAFFILDRRAMEGRRKASLVTIGLALALVLALSQHASAASSTTGALLMFALSCCNYTD
jgi:hypothetical protein